MTLPEFYVYVFGLKCYDVYHRKSLMTKVRKRRRSFMKTTTVEGRAKTKNGVTRLVFSVLCILLEVVQ